MEHLWAPWRNTYVTADKKKTPRLFWEIGQSGDDEKHYVVYRSKACYVILNRFPYNGGHLLVVPYREVADTAELSESEVQDLWKVVDLIKGVLKKAFSPQGFNIGINLGEASGAGFPNHVHVHVVPRWKDDANFMAATALTRIHPVDLDGIYKKMREVIQEMGL